MKLTFLIITPIVVLLLGGLAAWRLMEMKDDVVIQKPEIKPTLVRSMLVEAEDLSFTVETQGTVSPRLEITLISEVSGKALQVSPAMVSGGFFAKGDVLVQLDDRDYRLEVTRGEAQVAQAELALTMELAEAEIARQEWGSLGKGEPSPLVLREPQIAEARASRSAAMASLEKAKLDLDRCRLLAPFRGRVRNKSVDQGQFVGMGSALAQIYSIEDAEVRLPLRDEELYYLDLPLHGSNNKPGSPTAQLPTVVLTANFAGVPQQWEGRIVRTAGELDAKSRMVHAIARIEDPYGRGDSQQQAPLTVGMFVKAGIKGKTFTDVVRIPRAALRKNAKVLVMNLDANSKEKSATYRLEQRPVNILRQDKQHAFINQGLAAGERICLSPLVTVDPSLPVQIQEIAIPAESTSK